MKILKVTVDRLEGNYLILELPDKSTISVPKELFPGAKEGMVYSISPDKEEEEKRKEKVSTLFEKLKERK